MFLICDENSITLVITSLFALSCSPLLIYCLSLYVCGLLRSTESSFSRFIPFPIRPVCIDIIFNSAGLEFNTLSSQDYGTGDIFISNSLCRETQSQHTSTLYLGLLIKKKKKHAHTYTNDALHLICFSILCHNWIK